ncbi:MAG: AbrB/MazE/SpoVT family DNA-binding domain-containing protein [Candidatus Thiothrix sulfatifontis]|uniref:AbrB/MazE/SpoVT family DNA-binding domain-containing protein n=1 Tax=Thiothrix subterranea TaxID=2735563 RepID=A0AA51MKT3_9GAMM|nr:AbrB/MazE/SpoVT family DNA-binding domain-containing protein [Thiothrix subterranea]MDQ5770256.1 AbrB/MazE/SpoVT family DNA-binding domain-containing protein [Thiothrix subterranea]UOG91548.1 MAG: AbrB/MazE/SpoVT family DNA-binding domain-containing protein [Candidatus Thiothrix sulfatifontis]WML85798.1 AbrB/MazE/SpoVT family DNA-binding domain-containing protein [Thiothrix subterranea]
MTTATLRTVGNSVAVVIPKQWLSMLGLEAGAKVEMSIEGGKLTLQPKSATRRKKYKLADLLSKCDPSAPIPTAVTEWDNLPATGNEVW